MPSPTMSPLARTQFWGSWPASGNRSVRSEGSRDAEHGHDPQQNQGRRCGEMADAQDLKSHSSRLFVYHCVSLVVRKPLISQGEVHFCPFSRRNWKGFHKSPKLSQKL